MNTNELKIKADSLSLQFISKTAQVIVQSRVIGTGSKRNKWFNLELDDYDQLREELKFWKGQLSSTSTPPLILQIYADISKLKPTDTLLLTNSKTGRRTRIHNNDLIFLDHNKIERRKDKILLETWQLSLSYTVLIRANRYTTGEELSTVYKKCIVFFRTLYSYVRLMPTFEICSRLKSKNGICNIVYRIGTSRTSSPFEAGLGNFMLLDELHDINVGVMEMSFKSIETPTGVESDFEVEQESGELIQFEPDYFNARAVLKRNRLQKDASLPNDSLFIGSVGSDSSKKYGSLPQSSMPIPTRWSNVSPENQYPNTGILFKSLHAFTPPMQQEALFQGLAEQSSHDEIPFSGAYQFKSQSKKVIYDNASLFSASPPFAQARAEVICVNKPAELNTSITLARNPSLIFPSSPGLVMSSSPSLMPLLTSGSTSQPHVGLQQTPLNNPSPIDLGNLLSVLDRNLHLKPNVEANTTEFSDVSPISLQLDKFRKIGRTNQELVSSLRSQTESNVENNSIIEDAEMSGDSSKSRNVEWTTARESHTKYGSLLMSKVQGSHRRSKRRSTTTDGIFHDAAGAPTKGMSQSEQFPARHEEDEDLLFNMSMIE